MWAVVYKSYAYLKKKSYEITRNSLVISVTPTGLKPVTL